MTTPMPEAQVPMVVYYRYADGSYAQRTRSGYDEAPPVPEGAVEIDQAEYDAGIAALQQAQADQAAADAAAAREEARQEYEDLLEAGFPESTARRVSGYTPNPEES